MRLDVRHDAAQHGRVCLVGKIGGHNDVEYGGGGHLRNYIISFCGMLCFIAMAQKRAFVFFVPT